MDSLQDQNQKKQECFQQKKEDLNENLKNSVSNVFREIKVGLEELWKNKGPITLTILYGLIAFKFVFLLILIPVLFIAFFVKSGLLFLISIVPLSIYIIIILYFMRSIIFFMNESINFVNKILT